MAPALPFIPAKRYFTIGAVADLCAAKPHAPRYWEQQVTQLRPMKRRGNRRYYQHHEVLMIRRIRKLLYEQGFTISGARSRLLDGAESQVEAHGKALVELPASGLVSTSYSGLSALALARADFDELRNELAEIRALLSVAS